MPLLMPLLIYWPSQTWQTPEDLFMWSFFIDRLTALLIQLQIFAFNSKSFHSNPIPNQPHSNPIPNPNQSHSNPNQIQIHTRKKTFKSKSNPNPHEEKNIQIQIQFQFRLDLDLDLDLANQIMIWTQPWFRVILLSPVLTSFDVVTIVLAIYRH